MMSLIRRSSYCFMISLLTLSCGWISVITAFSASSSFTGGSTSNKEYLQRQQQKLTKKWSTFNKAGGMIMYDTSRDPPNSPELNAWAVIASTERWISDTLKANNNQFQQLQQNQQQQSSLTSSSASNPYARKEVSYYCETSKESSMVVAGIFRMLKESREKGENHGSIETDRAETVGEKDYSPKTMRETQVVVIPGNQELTDSFPVFDKLINTINQARRDARDYITDAMLEKIENASDNDDDDDKFYPEEWSVAINCAHLHPKFGEKTPEQVLQEMKDEPDEVDVNLEHYKRVRLQARRSPYPTVVMELRATPPPDFGASPAPYRSKYSTGGESSEYFGKGEEKITMADVQRLEALFGKSAVADKSKPSSDESFWNSIGNTIQEVTSVNPLKMAQQWISINDPTVIQEHTAFTETSTMHVDEAYEFVFTNLAMMTQDRIDECRYYLVMPHFLSSAATSFEKFSKQVMALVKCLPDIDNTKIIIKTYHPEHVNPEKRSPFPIFSMEMKKMKID